jgi:hypothetical protein
MSSGLALIFFTFVVESSPEDAWEVGCYLKARELALAWASLAAYSSLRI